MPLRVAVVGTCASGKSTVSMMLRERGYDAYAVAQEHSGVPELWRHQHPDRVVVLQNSLKTLRNRRNDTEWPQWIYETQLKRLTSARANADVLIETDILGLAEVVDRIVAAIGSPINQPVLTERQAE